MLLIERKNTRKKIEYKTVKDNTGKSYIGSYSDKEDKINIFNIDTGENYDILKNNIVSIEDTYNSFEQDVLDSRQIAYKITANSLYGQIGARTSSIYLKEIAACTTATGRDMIMLAKKFVEDNYGADVIYGDTDSIFCKFPLKDEEGNIVLGKDALPYAIKIGKQVEKEIAKIMPKPQKLNYEKSLYPFILLSKKRYVGNLYETDINSFKQKSMGIVLKRRDNAHIVKKIYGGVIDIILQKQDLRESIEFLDEELKDLVDGKTCINELVITKSIKASYKDPSKIAHKVLADRIGARDPGNRPCVNERIPFIYIKTNNPNSLQGDRIENPEYIKENNLIPDYLHYITNQIMKPILQLYALCLDQLPGYDKDDEYWDKIDAELKEKTMYNDDTKRKNRIQNLKLLSVKELLFDKYINILSEPKEPKVRKITKTTAKTTAKTDVKTTAKADVNKEQDINETVMNKEIISIEKEKMKRADKSIAIGTLKAEIKIAKNKTTGIVCSEAYICDGINKIWRYNKTGCKDKNKEFINIISKIINFNKDMKFIIKINNKKFVTDYSHAVIYYKERESSKETNVLENIFNIQDIGDIKIINYIRLFSDIIDNYKVFSLIAK
jgi:hypothetical protein